MLLGRRAMTDLFVVQSLSCACLQSNELQHTRHPCPSLSPRACSNSCQWCHPTISSSLVPFSSCLQSSPASRSFPLNQLFTSGGQSIGASASASVLQMNIQDWFPLGMTGWISLLSKGKIIALTIWTFVGKVMSLLFNMLSRFVIAFLLRSKWPLISWLQSPSAVILEPPKIKPVTVSIESPSICHEVMGPDAMIFIFLNVEF